MSPSSSDDNSFLAVFLGISFFFPLLGPSIIGSTSSGVEDVPGVVEVSGRERTGKDGMDVVTGVDGVTDIYMM